MIWDVAIVGAGPAGLAAALEARQVGCSVVVLERRCIPVDKACGEGLMPAGLAALERFGIRGRIPSAECATFSAIRFVQEDGRFVDGRLPEPGGLGIRRFALARAMACRVRELGAELIEDCDVRSHSIDEDGVTLDAGGRELRARLLVAADGLHSRLRRAEGLEVARVGPKRFGVRQHFATAPLGPHVEVHFTAGAEAYVTPVGERRIGVAILWEAGKGSGSVGFASLLERFPVLAARLKGIPVDSHARGAGPLRHDVRRRVKNRFLLLGDAAGYVDAITGEGLSLAFTSATALAEILPSALTRGATSESLQPYERTVSSAFGVYSRRANALLWVARRPGFRRTLIDRLIAQPIWFDRALQFSSSSPRPGRRAPENGAIQSGGRTPM